MIKDAEPNKYVLEAVKSPDPGHAPFGVMWATWPTFLNFGTHSIIFKRKKLDTSFFFVRSAVACTTQRTMNNK